MAPCYVAVVLWRDTKGRLEPVEQVVTPKALRPAVMLECHNEGGHFGRLKTYQRAREFCYWPHMHGDIADFVKRCGVCQQHGKHPAATPIKGHPSASTPGQQLMIDSLHLNDEVLPCMKKGDSPYKAMIVTIDVHSKYAVVQPVQELNSSTAAKFLITQVIGPFGHPDELITDGGGEFRKVFSEACEARQVKHHLR